MQKTLLKFAVFELIERVSRFRLMLQECADSLSFHAPVLHRQLLQEADALEERILEHKASLNRLFSESGARDGHDDGVPLLLGEVYARLCSASRILLHLKGFQVEPETALFLKDALPESLSQSAGEQSVFLTAEGNLTALESLSSRLTSPWVLLDTLSVLQKNNPLGWLGLADGYARHLRQTSPLLDSLKQEISKNGRKKAVPRSSSADMARDELLTDVLFRQAISLRLLGPAYYFHALSEAMLQQDWTFLRVMEPALFFGLNHQNFNHKSLVILHEACDRSKGASEGLVGADEKQMSPSCWNEEMLSSVYRAVEKLIPARLAFSEKHMERALQLRERMSQGILLSASPLYSLGEVSETLAKKEAQADFSIYEPLGMLTETPHSPREIVNAGWLHKMDRNGVWLYSVLNEDSVQGFSRLLSRLDEQDNLLRKSIDVSEVHRVLLCNL